MFFLFQLIISRGAVYFAIATTALDAISLAAAFLTGETTADLQALLTVFGFGS